MRTLFALAFVLAAAAAPLHGQRTAPVYHGDGYDITLPSRCSLTSTKTDTDDRGETQFYAFENENTMVMVARIRPREPIPDTALDTRRAFLRVWRAGMLRGGARWEIAGEPRDFERDDRVGSRLSVTLSSGRTRGRPVYGTAELSVARQGGLEMWMVVVFDRRDKSGTVASGERVLDSFRITARVAAESAAGGAVKAAKEGATTKAEA